jgi:hypothetical protein
VSIPSLTKVNPFDIKWQGDAITDIRTKYNYNLGVHEAMFSGSVGSAKSVLLAHLAVTHCLFNPGACLLIGRKSMPSLKDTILATILEHIADDLVEGVDYTHDKTRGQIHFSNGSSMISLSWADKKYKKARSYIFSAGIIEELTENDNIEFYKEIKMRVGRMPHIKEKFLISATNPDSPDHWAYEYFIESDNPLRHVYYSVTRDNKFLPQSYIDGIADTLSPAEARRMLYGEWVPVRSDDIVYSNYLEERNYINGEYKINPAVPIDIMHDFNIGVGKPMSAAAGQVIGNTFHCFASFIVEGADTPEIMEEIAASGLFENRNPIRVFGDASGKNKDTRSNRTDFEIIISFIKKYQRKDGSYPSVSLHLPRKNPAIRDRHNLANAQFLNENGIINFYCYDRDIDKGFKNTKLKHGSRFIEDDSYKLQHVTTAITYWVYHVVKYNNARIEPIRTR